MADTPTAYPIVSAEIIAKWRALLGNRMLLKPESPDHAHPVEAQLQEVTDRAFVKLVSPVVGAVPWWRHMSQITVLDVMPVEPPPIAAPKPALSLVPQGGQGQADQTNKPADVIPIDRAKARETEAAAPPSAPVPPKKKPGRPKKPAPPAEP